MNPPDDFSEEHYTLLLTKYEAALAQGQTPLPAEEGVNTPLLRQRLRRAQACLRRLRRFP